MLYLNTSIRGYPKGLRAGSDPRKPLLSIPEDFDSVQFNGVPYPLESIEVTFLLVGNYLSIVLMFIFYYRI